MSTRTIFLTGATGKIGLPLLRYILAEDYRIVLLVRRDEKTKICDPKVRRIYGDISDPSSYASSLAEVDTVVHMAAVTHTKNAARYYDINSAATLCLIRICKERGVKRFIFISTRAISEDGGHYSRSKSIAERYVKESGLDWVILRLAEVYGINGNTGVDMVLNNVDKLPFVPIVGNGGYKIAPVHISDAITSIARVIKDDTITRKTYNIAGPESITFNQFVDRVLEMKNLKKPKLHIPLFVIRICMPILAMFTKEGSLASDQLQRLICNKSDDISLAVKELNYDPAGLGEFLQKGAGT